MTDLTDLIARAELLIFDADGVLFDSESLSNRAWVDALAEEGLTITLDEMLDLGIGKTEPETRAELKRRYDLDLPDGFDSRIRARFDAANLQGAGLQPTARVAEFLTGLPKGTPRCIASNAQRKRTKIKLGQTDLTDQFDPNHIFGGMDYPRPKPHPDMHLDILQRFAVAPEKALVFEDSVVGAQAAVAAGIPFVGYLGVAHRPDTTAQTMREMGAVARWLPAGFKPAAPQT